MTPIEETNKLRQHILRCMNDNGEYVNALGFLRYEAFIKLTWREVKKLHDEYRESGIPFDTQMDRLILKQP